MKEKLLLRRNIKGFTLIELMITVAIIAILAAIAYPSYQGQLAKSRRSEAMVLLIEIMNRQDVFKSNYSTYTTIIKDPGGGCSGSACGLKLNSVDGDKSKDSGYYIVTAAAGPTGSIVSSVTLTATRVGGKAQSADLCGNFTLTSTGIKGLASNTYNFSQCWNR